MGLLISNFSLKKLYISTLSGFFTSSFLSLYIFLGLGYKTEEARKEREDDKNQRDSPLLKNSKQKTGISAKHTQPEPPKNLIGCSAQEATKRAVLTCP